MSLVKIDNRYIDHVAWSDTSHCDFVLDNTVNIWRINISSNLSHQDDFLTIMPPDELKRAGRYRHQRDRQRFIVSRGALRNILGKYLDVGPSLIEFEKTANKKPYIKNKRIPLCYNISHAGDWIVLAVSNSEIGVDTEHLDRSFDYKEVISEYFSEDEIDFINQKKTPENFFLLWTRKEALTKATGKGLDDDLISVPCLNGPHFTQAATISSTEDWTVSSFQLAGDQIATVAARASLPGIKFWDIVFS